MLLAQVVESAMTSTLRDCPNGLNPIRILGFAGITTFTARAGTSLCPEYRLKPVRSRIFIRKHFRELEWANSFVVVTSRSFLRHFCFVPPGGGV